MKEGETGVAEEKVAAKREMDLKHRERRLGMMDDGQTDGGGRDGKAERTEQDGGMVCRKEGAEREVANMSLGLGLRVAAKSRESQGALHTR